MPVGRSGGSGAANIIPGITVIPSGKWGLNRAQERTVQRQHTGWSSMAHLRIGIFVCSGADRRPGGLRFVLNQRLQRLIGDIGGKVLCVGLVDGFLIHDLNPIICAASPRFQP